MWIETIDGRIFEVISETETKYYAKEVLYKLDTPKLHYGKEVFIDKGEFV